MADPSVVKGLMHRLETRMMNIESYINRGLAKNGIIAHWSSNPPGFKFACKNQQGLMQDLVNNSHFAIDMGVGARFQKGVSFRENSKPESLHIILFKHVWVNEKSVNFKQFTDYVNIHLDSISVVAGRKSGSHAVQYEPGELLSHVFTDMLHVPLNFKRGPRLTIRFPGL